MTMKSENLCILNTRLDTAGAIQDKKETVDAVAVWFDNWNTTSLFRMAENKTGKANKMAAEEDNDERTHKRINYTVTTFKIEPQYGFYKNRCFWALYSWYFLPVHIKIWYHFLFLC